MTAMFSIFTLGEPRSKKENKKDSEFFSLCHLLLFSLMLYLHKLIHAVYADYARSLKLLGFKQGAVLFASKAGEAGRELLTELKQPKEGVTQE